MPPRATAYGIRRPRSACEPVSKPVCRSHPRRPSPDAHVSGSPLDSEVLLRVPSQTIQPVHGLAAWSSPDWVSALLATSPSGVHTSRRASNPPLRSVLRLSQPLDGLLRPSAPQACFILPPRPGFRSPFRGFSPAAAAPPSSRVACPHAVAGAALTQASLSCHAITASTSRPSSASGRVVGRRGLAADPLAPLIGFRSLRDQPSHPSAPGSPSSIRPRCCPPRSSVAR